MRWAACGSTHWRRAKRGSRLPPRRLCRPPPRRHSRLRAAVRPRGEARSARERVAAAAPAAVAFADLPSRRLAPPTRCCPTLLPNPTGAPRSRHRLRTPLPLPPAPAPPRARRRPLRLAPRRSRHTTGRSSCTTTTARRCASTSRRACSPASAQR
jgi:hypothetical protein